MFNNNEESEFLESLHNLTLEILELEKSGKWRNTEYTDKDVIAATVVFAHILGNKSYFMLKEEHASLGLSETINKNNTEQIKLLTKHMSGVQISKYPLRNNQ